MKIRKGSRVRSLLYGDGTVKEVYGVCGARVEFDKFMNGHTCGGLCKDGHGWSCRVFTKKVCERNAYSNIPVYLIGDEEGWD